MGVKVRARVRGRVGVGVRHRRQHLVRVKGER